MAVPRMEYVEYDPAYSRAFERLVEVVHSVLPGFRVEHVGSTSVPGLGGRGVLDTVIPSRPEDHSRMVAALASVGFTDFPYGPAKPLLTRSVQVDRRDYQVLLYLLPPEHEFVGGWLAFRDYMRRNPEEVERYAQVKQAAIAAGKTNPGAYQQAKTPYLIELAQRIGKFPSTDHRQECHARA